MPRTKCLKDTNFIISQQEVSPKQNKGGKDGIVSTGEMVGGEYYKYVGVGEREGGL